MYVGVAPHNLTMSQRPLNSVVGAVRCEGAKKVV
jgi:hypothetical protein